MIKLVTSVNNNKALDTRNLKRRKGQNVYALPPWQQEVAEWGEEWLKKSFILSS